MLRFHKRTRICTYCLVAPQFQSVHRISFRLFQFIFAAVLAVAAAAPSDLSYEQDIIEILRQNIDHNDDHSYQQS